MAKDEEIGDDGAPEEHAGVVVLVVGLAEMLENMHRLSEGVVVHQFNLLVVVTVSPSANLLAGAVGAALDSPVLVFQLVLAVTDRSVRFKDGERFDEETILLRPLKVSLVLSGGEERQEEGQYQ